MREVMGWGAIVDWLEFLGLEPYTMYAGIYSDRRLYVFGFMHDEFQALRASNDLMDQKQKDLLPFWHWYTMDEGQPREWGTKMPVPDRYIDVRGYEMRGWLRANKHDSARQSYNDACDYVEQELQFSLEEEHIDAVSCLISDLAFHNSLTTAHFLKLYQGHREELEPEWEQKVKN